MMEFSYRVSALNVGGTTKPLFPNKRDYYGVGWYQMKQNLFKRFFCTCKERFRNSIRMLNRPFNLNVCQVFFHRPHFHLTLKELLARQLLMF